MAGDEDRKTAAYKRVLETFKIQKLLRGQDVFVIQPPGSGKLVSTQFVLSCVAV